LNPNPQIIVLDAGGQYCHLEARKVRDLGVYAEVRASETPAAELATAKGLIISGGPSSVYDPGSPTVDPAIFSSGQAVLGICYGQQIMAHLLGGEVRRGEKGEYGMATLELDNTADPMFAGLAGRQQIWMSHRDLVGRVPQGFSVAGRTDTCPVAAIAWRTSSCGCAAACPIGIRVIARPSSSRKSASAWARATSSSSSAAGWIRAWPSRSPRAPWAAAACAASTWTPG
jgi:GMP synthase (glutamine-hydrolysing) A subunit